MTSLTTETSSNRIPVSIITGFLGSGKTTLISHLVVQPGMDKTALIINEFGDIGIDNQLVASSIENTLLLENGCICCSIRGDLIDTISDIFAKAQADQIPQFSRILIETTGLANPGPIVKSIQSEAAVINRCQLNNVITLVDGVQGSPQIVQHEEVVVQIAQADIALISKSDLTSAEEIQALTKDVLKINPTLEIKAIEQGRINPEILFKRTIAPPIVTSNTERHHHDPQNEFNHGDIATWSLVQNEPIDEERLRNWLLMLYTLRPFAMLRMKGFVRFTTSKTPVLIQAVGNIISPLEWHESWPDDTPQTQLVLIFKGLLPEAVKASFRTHVLNSTTP